jgi:hypothetical protein
MNLYISLYWNVSRYFTWLALQLPCQTVCSHSRQKNNCEWPTWTVSFLERVRLSPLGMSATIWPIVPDLDDRRWVWSSQWNENWHGKPKYSEKTCPSATLSTTNPITRTNFVGYEVFTMVYLAWPLLWLWRQRRHILLKRRLTFSGLHGVMTELFKNR